MRVGPIIAKRLGASFYFVPAKPHTEKLPFRGVVPVSPQAIKRLWESP
jgi:hypothetical protein